MLVFPGVYYRWICALSPSAPILKPRQDTLHLQWQRSFSESPQGFFRIQDPQHQQNQPPLSWTLPRKTSTMGEVFGNIIDATNKNAGEGPKSGIWTRGTPGVVTSWTIKTTRSTSVLLVVSTNPFEKYARPSNWIIYPQKIGMKTKK